jgi:hypothetical protein
MRACSFHAHESKLLPHFDDHLPLPTRKKQYEDISHLTQIPEKQSHNICLGSLKKAFEHCSILLVPSLGVSLPFCQTFLDALSINLLWS